MSERNKLIKTICILFVVYIIVAVPFKVMTIIPGFTDIRPVTVLGPIYAVFFGVPGCVVFAVGNLVMDVLSDSLRWSSIGGLIANFAGPFMIWLYYSRSKVSFALRTGKEIMVFSALVLLSAVLEMAIITPMVYAVYPDVDWLTFGLSVLANTAVFPLIPGIPVIMLMQDELGSIPVRLGRDKER